MNLFAKQKQTYRLKKQTYVTKGEGGKRNTLELTYTHYYT